MFMAELGVMRKLSHPYIVRYLGCGVLTEDPGVPGATSKNHIAIVRLPSYILRALSASITSPALCLQWTVVPT